MPDKIDVRTLKGNLSSINALPTVPSTMRRISVVMEKPSIGLDELGSLISNDPALTVKILKVINSAAYGFPGRIASVSHATMLLGLSVIKGLLIGVSVFELMEKTMIGLWEHSMGSAVVTRLIAQKKGLKEPEEVSICGLLHDIGKAVLMLQYAEMYKKAMKEAEREGKTIHEAEADCFMADHAEIGHWLVKRWNFPMNLVETIRHHHHPNLSLQSPLETAIVHVADVLVRAKGVGYPGDLVVPAVHPAAWKLLNLSENDVGDILQGLEDTASGAQETL